jgi:hypothetical protein
VSPYFVTVPDTLKTVAFIEKDTKRFPDTHGWAFAQWAYDPATDTFKPSELDPRMILGATAFEGVVCNSSADICASDDFAKMGLTPAPSTSRLKSRRFIEFPHSTRSAAALCGR